MPLGPGQVPGCLAECYMVHVVTSIFCYYKLQLIIFVFMIVIVLLFLITIII